MGCQCEFYGRLLIWFSCAFYGFKWKIESVYNYEYVMCFQHKFWDIDKSAYKFFIPKKL